MYELCVLSDQMDSDALERSLGGSAQQCSPLEVLSQIEGPGSSFQQDALDYFCYTQLASQVSPHQDYPHCTCACPACPSAFHTVVRSPSRRCRYSSLIHCTQCFLPFIRSVALLLPCGMSLASLVFAALSNLTLQLVDTGAFYQCAL